MPGGDAGRRHGRHGLLVRSPFLPCTTVGRGALRGAPLASGATAPMPLRPERRVADTSSVTKRALVLPGVILAATLAVASCGGQPFPQTLAKSPGAPGGTAMAAATPQAQLLAAVKRATELKTARIGLNMSVSGVGADQGIAIDGSGVMDMSNQRMSMTMHEGNPPISIETRVIGRTAYTKVNGRWTSVSLGTAGAATANPDPTGYLAYLQGVSDDVHVDGHEVLRGDETTRYAGTIDLDRAIAQQKLSAEQHAAISSAVELFGDLQIPTKVWVDLKGRLRKLSISMDLSDAMRRVGVGAGLHPKLDLTMELYDFGVAVNVPVPSGASAASGGSGGSTAETNAQDHVATSDLRNALTAEKTFYTDQMTYTADVSTLRQIEPSLDWGGRLKVFVGDAATPATRAPCASPSSRSRERCSRSAT